MNIVLTGFMGTGKSEVGRLLASKLGWQFFDVDELIEKESGLKISDIFARSGEIYFRKLETETIRLVSLSEKVVIACGGGAVLKEENMEALEKNGVVVCLKADPEKIFERIKNEKHRPLLAVKDPMKKLKELLGGRAKFYARCSFSIDTTNLSPKEITEEILKNPRIKKGLAV